MWLPQAGFLAQIRCSEWLRQEWRIDDLINGLAQLIVGANEGQGQTIMGEEMSQMKRPIFGF